MRWEKVLERNGKEKKRAYRRLIGCEYEDKYWKNVEEHLHSRGHTF